MVDLDPQQLNAIKELKNGSILKGGVGTGKSRTAIAYYFRRVCGGTFPINGSGDFSEFQDPRPLYILTTAKKRDDLEWFDELLPFLISSDPESSFGGIQVTVDSWNNIGKYKEVKDAFFIFDEQRLVGSGAWVKSFHKIAKNNQWLLLSATPGDNWQDYIPVFVAHGFYRNRTEFLERHAVYNRYSKYPKIDRFVDTGVLVKYRAAILVPLHYRRHTKRLKHNHISVFDEIKYKQIVEKRWNPWDDKPIENISQLFYMMRRVVNEDPSRLSELTSILDNTKKLIVFYNFNYELELLRGYLSDRGITYSEWNGQKHQPIPDTDSWVYLVQYTAGAEGWNCVATDTVLFYSLNYSWRIMEQCEGRIDRRNTPYTDLHYHVIRSTSNIDQSIMKALKTKQKFNESSVAESMGIKNEF